MKIISETTTPFYDQLLGMVPDWLSDFKEMDASYQFAAWTLDLMEHFINKIINNIFPRQCDEDTLSLLEELMSIEYSDTPTIEERRNTVSTYWAGYGKASSSLIKSMVGLYTGRSATVIWRDLDTNAPYLEIQVDNSDELPLDMTKLLRILKRILPAHIAYAPSYREEAALEIQASVSANKLVYKACGHDGL